MLKQKFTFKFICDECDIEQIVEFWEAVGYGPIVPQFEDHFPESWSYKGILILCDKCKNK